MDINGFSKKGLLSSQTTADSPEGDNRKAEAKPIEKETTDREKYVSSNKDGDTLEVSKDTSNVIISRDEGQVSVRMSDAALAKCSLSKLQQLLSNGSITRQQYEKAKKNIVG